VMGGGGDKAGMTEAGATGTMGVVGMRGAGAAGTMGVAGTAGPSGGLGGLAVEDDWVDEDLVLRGIFSN
jgi:hypothetical protein